MKIKSLNDLPVVRAYLDRVGAEPRSLTTAVVREVSGKYWRDLAVIRFKKSGEVSCNSVDHAPTPAEEVQIAQEFTTVQWPQIKLLKRIVNPPAMIKDAAPEAIFEFRDLAGMIQMVQVRVQREEGKAYVPWTYWDDDEWRMCEPDGPLPLFNADKLKDAHTVFIHEGAKAASFVQRMTEAKTPQDAKIRAEHPWGVELSGAVHVGWIGGALSPYRTDWSTLTKAGVKRAYIVADNDTPGKAAVPAISEQLRMPTFSVQFTDDFPVSFDLADAFPAKMFGSVGATRHYIGPSFRDCLHPATWATDSIANPRGKPTVVLRESFRAMWAYVEEADAFVCTEMPEIMRSEQILNKMLAPFSHVVETTRLIVRAYRGRTSRIAYDPSSPGLIVTSRNSSAINLHVSSSIKPAKGDPKPWLDYIDYMFVHESERTQVMRWCATLIARPEIRMSYALLLISERQGIGKTTLGSMILAPLVGLRNVGYPSEGDIVQSTFNDWMASRRLIIVNEIYSGSSWKAYHSLKSVITDKDVTVNQKYMRAYTLDNWAHVLACSNSMRALKMENDDRRWFYPEMTEEPWPTEKFVEFRAWLSAGGLRIIRHWAENYGNYVGPGERAPMTERKRELIEGSRSEAQREASALAFAMKELGKPASVYMTDVIAWIKANVQGTVYDTDYEIRRVMKESGLRQYEDRIKANGRLQYVLINAPLNNAIHPQMLDKDRHSAIRSANMRPNQLMESSL